MERSQTYVFMEELLKLMRTRGGSDLFITAHFPPAMKLDGKLQKLSPQNLSPAQTMALARAIMNDKQAAQFESTNECNFAISPAGVGRFRVNAFLQQGMVGLVLRTLPDKPPTLDELQMPEIIKKISMVQRGLVIFVGATGAGKSTTLAAMVDHRNEHSAGHIVTIEDPIEFVHTHKNCVITQREIGMDTHDWEVALKNSLRQAPDVILMGEIRDARSMELAVTFAETGHLCLATLHANSANQALARIVDFFPESKHEQLLRDLSLNLRAIVSQRLVPKQNSQGRVAALEVMVNTPYIAELIFKSELGEIKDAMKKGAAEGMVTFDQSLFDLYERKQINLDDALHFADSRNEVRLNVKLNSKRQGGAADLNEGLQHLAVVR